MEPSTWYALREFETRDITARAFKSRHALTLSAGKAREISSHFIQAREYFRNAANADFTVRPLLLYYGVASLGRGVTLFLEPQKREGDLRASHGLQACDWTKELTGGGLSRVGDLRVRLTGGGFPDLLASTGNKFYFRSNSSAVNWALGGEIPALGVEVALRDVAARVPAISGQYEVWTEEQFPSVTLNALSVDSQSDVFEFKVSGSSESIDVVFPESLFPGRKAVTSESSATITTSQKVVPHFAQGSSSFGIGDIVLFRPLESGLYLTPLASCYVLSFFLGMLCRYFPTSWMSLARGEVGDAFYPLATRLLDWIEATLPAMVVDILRGPYEFEKA